MITTLAAKRVAVAVLAATIGLGLGLGTTQTQAADEGHAQIASQPWTFAGVRGHFDDAQLQRGFKVYTEVCARCHSINRIAFRNQQNRFACLCSG